MSKLEKIVNLVFWAWIGTMVYSNARRQYRQIKEDIKYWKEQDKLEEEYPLFI